VLRDQIDVRVGQVIDGAPTHDSTLNAGQQHQHGKREDEGIEAQLDHHEAVKGSDDKSDQQNDGDPDKWVNTSDKEYRHLCPFMILSLYATEPICETDERQLQNSFRWRKAGWLDAYQFDTGTIILRDPSPET